jgi:hypothetical protein
VPINIGFGQGIVPSNGGVSAPAAQDFDLTVDLTGNVFGDGSGAVVNTKAKIEPFKFTPPLNHSLSLFGGAITTSSDPKTDPLGTVFDMNATTLLDMNDLDLDLLNGQTVDFALDTIFITTNSTVSLLKSISIDVSGTLTGLRFDQTAPAIVAGGPGSGTFAVGGDLTATVDNLLAVVFGLLQVPVGTQQVTLPFVLTGNWTQTGPTNNVKIELDGGLAADIPITLMTNLTTAITDVLSLTISSTIDLAASLTLAYNYYLEQSGIIIPEPSSIILLGLGLCAAMVPAVHRMRRRGK